MSNEATQATRGRRIHDRIATWVGRPVFWVLFVFTIATYPFIHALTHELPEALPALSEVADFELTDEYNQPFGTKQLKNKMWIVASICTACSDQVEEMGQRLFRVQHRSRGVGKRFRLVAISRDPERDSPRMLEAWAKGLRYSPRMWTLLTGPKTHVETVLANIFQPPAVQSRLPGTLPGLEDRYKVALVDVAGQIRGYFDIRTDEGLETLLTAMRMVINRGY
ncbi:MAG: SCO family protein [Myxococcota bacterium]|nr:SCO family protein [Myxococcota bacterium]